MIDLCINGEHISSSDWAQLCQRCSWNSCILIDNPVHGSFWASWSHLGGAVRNGMLLWLISSCRNMVLFICKPQRITFPMQGKKMFSSHCMMLYQQTVCTWLFKSRANMFKIRVRLFPNHMQEVSDCDLVVNPEKMRTFYGHTYFPTFSQTF